MSGVKSAFKALTAEQQAIVANSRVSGSHSPDEWLRLLGPVADDTTGEDADANAVLGGEGAGLQATSARRRRDARRNMRAMLRVVVRAVCALAPTVAVLRVRVVVVLAVAMVNLLLIRMYRDELLG